jgi:DnaK suppressor protein
MVSRDMKRLRKTYVQLIEHLVKTIENSEYEIDVAGDEVDEIQGKSIINVQEKLSRNNIIKLRKLERAVMAIDEGMYGICEECDEPIGIKRLEAIPGVVLCVSCAERAEMNK